MIVMASASDDCVTIVLSLSHERIVFPSAELSSTLSNVDVYVEAYMPSMQVILMDLVSSPD